MKKKAILFLLSALILTACAETSPQTSGGETFQTESSTETSESAQRTDTVTFSGMELRVVGVNVKPTGDGVYIYDRNAGDSYTYDGYFVDYAVCNHIITIPSISEGYAA